MFVALSGRATDGAQAITGALVCCIPLDALNARVRDNPDVAVRLVRSLSRDRALAFDHLTSVGRCNARERVARLVLELFVRCRTQWRSEEHTSELQSLMRISYAVFCLKKKKDKQEELTYVTSTETKPQT